MLSFSIPMRLFLPLVLLLCCSCGLVVSSKEIVEEVVEEGADSHFSQLWDRVGGDEAVPVAVIEAKKTIKKASQILSRIQRLTTEFRQDSYEMTWSGFRSDWSTTFLFAIFSVFPSPQSTLIPRRLIGWTDLLRYQEHLKATLALSRALTASLEVEISEGWEELIPVMKILIEILSTEAIAPAQQLLRELGYQKKFHVNVMHSLPPLLQEAERQLTQKDGGATVLRSASESEESSSKSKRGAKKDGERRKKEVQKLHVLGKYCDRRAKKGEGVDLDSLHEMLYLHYSLQGHDFGEALSYPVANRLSGVAYEETMSGVFSSQASQGLLAIVLVLSVTSFAIPWLCWTVICTSVPTNKGRRHTLDVLSTTFSQVCIQGILLCAVLSRAIAVAVSNSDDGAGGGGEEEASEFFAPQAFDRVLTIALFTMQYLSTPVILGQLSLCFAVSQLLVACLFSLCPKERIVQSWVASEAAAKAAAEKRRLEEVEKREEKFVGDLFQAAWHGRIADIDNLFLHHPNCTHLVNQSEKLNGRTALQQASLKGQTAAIRILLSEYGADVNATGSTKQRTALHYAVERDDPLPVRVLLQEGKADPTILDEDGASPLFRAASFQHGKALLELLPPNCPCETTINLGKNDSGRGRAALHNASLEGHLPIVQLLLGTGGADPNLVEPTKRRTPLHYAVERGHLQVVLELLAANVDPATEDAEGQVPLAMASASGHVDVVRELLKAENEGDRLIHHMPPPGAVGRTALQGASLEGHLQVVQLLLEHGADTEVNTKDMTLGRTAVYFAAERGHLEVLRLLLKAGGDPFHIEDTEGASAFRKACAVGRLAIVVELLKPENMEEGFSVNSQSTLNRRTALHSAALEGHLQVVQLLLQHGADANSRATLGRTALHFAAERGHLQVVRALISLGKADPTLLDEEGSSALVRASDCQRHEVLTELCKFEHRGHEVIDLCCNRKGRNALHEASLEGHLGVVRILLASGANPNAKSPLFLDRTPLHYAAERGHLQVVMALLDAKGDPTPVDKEGASALHRAVVYDRAEVVAVLMQKKHEGDLLVNVAVGGRTPLHFASLEGHLATVNTLLEVTPAGGTGYIQLDNQEPAMGRTPLHYAAERGHLEVVRALVKAGARSDIIDNEGRNAMQTAVVFGHHNVRLAM